MGATMPGTKKILVEAPAHLMRNLRTRGELPIFGLLQDWKTNPQKLKDELREED